MTRSTRHRAAVAAALVLAIAVAWLCHRRAASEGAERARTAASTRKPTGLAVRGGATVRGGAAAPMEVRAATWLAEHPPSAELHQALVAIARQADHLRTPIEAPAAADDLLAARRERRAGQDALRGQLRVALTLMTPTERADLRAAHLNVIQLARQVAGEKDPS